VNSKGNEIVTEGNSPRPCFPWDKMDDMILFGMMFALVIVVGWLGHWDLVSNLASGLLGAVTMYIKGGRKE
jgi:hypothetical protein